MRIVPKVNYLALGLGTGDCKISKVFNRVIGRQLHSTQAKKKRKPHKWWVSQRIFPKTTVTGTIG